MPADKLILLTPVIAKPFALLARNADKSKGGYLGFVDLRKTSFEIPALLYYKGFRGGINKIEIVGVSALGLNRVEEIVLRLCDGLHCARIWRIDWALDVLGVPAWTIANCCRVARKVNSAFFRSRSGVSFYPHRSRERTILIYERLKLLRLKNLPQAAIFKADDELTRLEVQLRGRGVPIRKFASIRGYAHLNLLEDLTFIPLQPISKGLGPQQLLAAERMQAMMQDLGAQGASKRFSSTIWANLTKSLFEPTNSELPNFHKLMQKSTQDWLENRVRFPRPGGHASQENTW